MVSCTDVADAAGTAANGVWSAVRRSGAPPGRTSALLAQAHISLATGAAAHGRSLSGGLRTHTGRAGAGPRHATAQPGLDRPAADGRSQAPVMTAFYAS